MNRIAHLLTAPASRPVDWSHVRLVGERAKHVRSPGDLMLVLADLFPGHTPYADLPAHLKLGDTPEAALAALIDGVRDALNHAIEDENGGPEARYFLREPEGE